VRRSERSAAGLPLSTRPLPARRPRPPQAACALALALAISVACSSPPGRGPTARRFTFDADTFAWANELYWEYDFDHGAGAPAVHARPEPTEYGQRCIAMVRAAREFLRAARFVPEAPALGEAETRSRVRTILDADPRAEAPLPAPVTIPGFADLRSFSRAHEALLKAELGGFVTTYFQRGNWRLILPFFANGQRDTAHELRGELERGETPIVHVVNFPVIDINHALLLFEVEETASGLRFAAYDPNQPDRPLPLFFDEDRSAFRLPRTPYFAGGRVKVWEIYRGLFF
jgi:hypothetical protein